ILLAATQAHRVALGLDVRVNRPRVQARDHVPDRLPGTRGGAHQQGVGLVHRRHADAVALHLEGDAAVAVLARVQLQRTVAEPTAAARPAPAAVHAAGKHVAGLVAAAVTLAARAARADRQRIGARRQRYASIATG